MGEGTEQSLRTNQDALCTNHSKPKEYLAQAGSGLRDSEKLRPSETTRGTTRAVLECDVVSFDRHDELTRMHLRAPRRASMPPGAAATRDCHGHLLTRPSRVELGHDRGPSVLVDHHDLFCCQGQGSRQRLRFHSSI